jgi:DNA-3-methyladenine glycosylase
VRSRIIRSDFFQRDPITCARELIGAQLIWGKCAGKIVETEAYLEHDDEACHTFSRPSARAFIERNKPGAAYIYFSYGAHWMLNVLVKGKTNGFVLFRAVEPRRGIELMKKRRKIEDERRLCSGPGKLTQAFEITNRHHEMNLCVDPMHCFAYSDDEVDLSRRSRAKADVVADERIGISRSAHHPWRFTERGSKFLSRRVKS